MAFEPRGSQALDRGEGVRRARPLADEGFERLVREDAIGGLLRLARPLRPHGPEEVPERVASRGIGRVRSAGGESSSGLAGGAGCGARGRRSRPPRRTFARSPGRARRNGEASCGFRAAQPDSVRLTIGRKRSTSWHSTSPATARASRSWTTSACLKSARTPKVLSFARPHRDIFSEPEPVSICATVVLPNRPLALATPERAFRSTSIPAAVPTSTASAASARPLADLAAAVVAAPAGGRLRVAEIAEDVRAAAAVRQRIR